MLKSKIFEIFLSDYIIRIFHLKLIFPKIFLFIPLSLSLDLFISLPFTLAWLPLHHRRYCPLLQPSDTSPQPTPLTLHTAQFRQEPHWLRPLTFSSFGIKPKIAPHCHPGHHARSVLTSSVTTKNTITCWQFSLAYKVTE